jgi:alanine-glyoxylate transaminase/serine-glyoxylate transaminase/serine-pyruvate transaminase
MLSANAAGFFPTTPATNLLFGLREALQMLQEEGLPQVFARHQRLAAAARTAVRAWQLDIVCERDDEHSPVVTAVSMPTGSDADQLRALILERFNLSLGAGLGRLKGTAFRIGHLGEFNDVMLIGTLGGIELGLAAAGLSFRRGGVAAALEQLSSWPVAAGTPLSVR